MDTLTNFNNSQDKPSATLSEIVDLSQQMLVFARAGEWSQVAELEQRRKGMIESLAVNEEKPNVLKMALEQVLECDRQVVSLAQETKQAIASALSDISKFRHGIDQYYQNQLLE